MGLMSKSPKLQKSAEEEVASVATKWEAAVVLVVTGGTDKQVMAKDMDTLAMTTMEVFTQPMTKVIMGMVDMAKEAMVDMDKATDKEDSVEEEEGQEDAEPQEKLEEVLIKIHSSHIKKLFMVHVNFLSLQPENSL